jgi:hypothetical protein
VAVRAIFLILVCIVSFVIGIIFGYVTRSGLIGSIFMNSHLWGPEKWAPFIALTGSLFSTLVLIFSAYLALQSYRSSYAQNESASYAAKVSNINQSFLVQWKEKEFSLPVKVLTCEGVDGERRAFNTTEEVDKNFRIIGEDVYNKKSDIRNLVRRNYHLQYIKDGDPYSEQKKKLIELWDDSLKKNSWQKKATYNISWALQDLGALVRSGAMPAGFVFINGARLIIEEWVFCLGLVYEDFRKSGHNIQFRALTDNPELGAVRRHAEWLACASAIYWYNNYQNGYTHFYISEIARACAGSDYRRCVKAMKGLYNIGDKMNFNMPIDINCIKKRERELFSIDCVLSSYAASERINNDISAVLYPHDKRFTDYLFRTDGYFHNTETFKSTRKKWLKIPASPNRRSFG